MVDMPTVDRIIMAQAALYYNFDNSWNILYKKSCKSKNIQIFIIISYGTPIEQVDTNKYKK